MSDIGRSPSNPPLTATRPLICDVQINVFELCERLVQVRPPSRAAFAVNHNTFEPSFVQMALEPPALQMNSKRHQNDLQMTLWMPLKPPYLKSIGSI